MSRPSIIPAPLADLPWRMLLLIIAIAGFGLVVLYSAAGGHLKPWALSQGVRFLVLLSGAILLSRVREEVWRQFALPAYAVIVAMLFAVEALGAVRGGSQRWLDLGFIRLQPSEIMKPAIVLACARFYDMLPPKETRRFGAIWPALLLIGLPAGLVMLQPDLGTALMITAGGVTVMFLAGIPLRLFVGMRARSRFAKLTAAGLATTIFFYLAINLSMVMGLAPVVGIPLPLVSFGGSAQMTVFLCLGILMSIDRNNRGERRG